jgi:hypothetical protein
MKLSTNEATLAELQAKVNTAKSKADTLDNLVNKTQKEMRDILVSATQKTQENLPVAQA